MKESIVGRKSEIERLQKYIASDRSEFIAVYGRRRVGKTFKTLQVAYITPHGLYDNVYARKVKKQLTADHLFGA